MYEPRDSRFRHLLRLLLRAVDAPALVASVLLAMLCLVWPVTAQASFPATSTSTGCSEAPCYEYSVGAAGWSASKPAACALRAGSAGASWGVCSVTSTSPSCTYTCVNNEGAPAGGSTEIYDSRTVAPVSPNYSCPANSTLSGSTCTCTAPAVQNAANNGCEANPCVSGPAGFHRGSVAGEKVNPFNTCQGGCVTLAAPRLDLGVTFYAGPPPMTNATFQLVRNGQTCNGDNGSYPELPSENTTPTEPSPVPECPAGQRRVYLADASPSCQPIPVDRFCPAGYTYGTVNGKDTCISQGTSPPTSSSPASVDKTPTVESKEKTTEVVNPDGTTTTTTVKSDGKGGGSETVTVKSADGKTIESTTKKVGDDTPKCVEGTAGCTKLGTPSEGTVPKADVQVGTLTPGSMAGFNIGHSCPPDLTFNMLGATQRIEFKMLCDHADWIKPIVVLLAGLTAMFIVYNAITGSNT